MAYTPWADRTDQTVNPDDFSKWMTGNAKWAYGNLAGNIPVYPDYVGDQKQGPVQLATNPLINMPSYQMGQGGSFDPRTIGVDMMRDYARGPYSGRGGGGGGGAPTITTGNITIGGGGAGMLGAAPELSQLMGGDYEKLEAALRDPATTAATRAYERSRADLDARTSAGGMYGSSFANRQANEGLNREFQDSMARAAADAVAKRYGLQSQEYQAINNARNQQYGIQAGDVASQRGLQGQLASAQASMSNAAAAAQASMYGADQSRAASEYGSYNNLLGGVFGDTLNYDVNLGRMNQDDRQFGWKAGVTQAENEKDWWDRFNKTNYANKSAERDWANQQIDSRFNYQLAKDAYNQGQMTNLFQLAGGAPGGGASLQNSMQLRQLQAQLEAQGRQAEAAQIAALIGAGGTVLGGLMGSKGFWDSGVPSAIGSGVKSAWDTVSGWF